MFCCFNDPTESDDVRPGAGVLGRITLTGIYSWELDSDEENDISSDSSSDSDFNTAGDRPRVSTKMHGEGSEGTRNANIEPQQISTPIQPQISSQIIHDRHIRDISISLQNELLRPLITSLDEETMRAHAMATAEAHAQIRRQKAEAKQQVKRRAVEKRKCNIKLANLWNRYFFEQAEDPDYVLLNVQNRIRKPSLADTILNEPDDEDNVVLKKYMQRCIEVAILLNKKHSKGKTNTSALDKVSWETKLFGSQNAGHFNRGEMFSAQALVVMAEKQLGNRFKVYLVKTDLLANIYCPGGEIGSSANRKGKKNNPFVLNTTTWKNDLSRALSRQQRLVYDHLFTVCTLERASGQMAAEQRTLGEQNAHERNNRYVCTALADHIKSLGRAREQVDSPELIGKLFRSRFARSVGPDSVEVWLSTAKVAYEALVGFPSCGPVPSPSAPMPEPMLQMYEPKLLMRELMRLMPDPGLMMRQLMQMMPASSPMAQMPVAPPPLPIPLGTTPQSPPTQRTVRGAGGEELPHDYHPEGPPADLRLPARLVLLKPIRKLTEGCSLGRVAEFVTIPDVVLIPELYLFGLINNNEWTKTRQRPQKAVAALRE